MARRVFSTIGNVGVRLVAKPTPSLSKPAKIVNHFSDRKFTPEAGEEERAIIRLFVRETEDRSVKATINYTIPISQSTRKAQVLVGGGSEGFRVGDAADACSVKGGGILGHAVSLFYDYVSS